MKLVGPCFICKKTRRGNDLFYRHYSKFIRRPKCLFCKEETRIRRIKTRAKYGFNPKQVALLKELCGNKCCNCGGSFMLEADHVIPLCVGGTNNLNNGQVLCHKCHWKKNRKTIDHRNEWIKQVIEKAVERS